MVRRRIKERCKARFTEKMMAGAVKSVVEEGLSLRSSAQLHGVKFTTLQRYVRKKKNNPEVNVRMAPNYAARLIFSHEQEVELSRYLKICSKMSYGLTTRQVKKLSYEMAIRKKIKVPTSWNNNKCAGRDWLMAFIKRCGKLSIIKPPSVCSLSRLPLINPHYVKRYFSNLEEILTAIPDLVSDNRIYNLGEISITTDEKFNEDDITENEVQSVSGDEPGAIVTTCAIICTDGTFFPPVMVFPKIYLKQNLMIAYGAPEGTFGFATPNGCMTQSSFTTALDHFIRLSCSSKNNPTLLICDSQESHISVSAVNRAMEAGVILLTLPPGSNNKLQPLDVSVFTQFKTSYNLAMESRVSNHPENLFTINQVASCVGEAYSNAFTSDNILLGFKNTGIFPFDKNILRNDTDFKMSSVSHATRCQDEDQNIRSEFENFDQPGPSNSRHQDAEPKISSLYFTAHEEFQVSDFVSYPEIKKGQIEFEDISDDFYELHAKRHFSDVYKSRLLPEKAKMVRNYIRKKPAVDKEQLEKAKKAVANGLSMQSAAREFGVSYSTLRIHCGDVSKRVGTRPKTVNQKMLAAALNAVRGGMGVINAAKQFNLNYETLRSSAIVQNVLSVKQKSQEVQDNKETTYAEIESVFLNEDLDSPFDPTSLSCENGLESIPTSDIDQKSEKNRTFVEYIYQVLIGLPPSKANQVRQKIYNILFQAEEESDVVVNQAGSSNSTLCNNETEVKYENP